MGKEEIIGLVLNASPAMLRRFEAVLRDDEQGRRKVQSEEDNRLVSISSAARLLMVGRNTVYKLIKTERLDTVDLNGCKRITMRSIRQFIAGERPANEKTATLIAASKARYAATKANAMEGGTK